MSRIFTGIVLEGPKAGRWLSSRVNPTVVPDYVDNPEWSGTPGQDRVLRGILAYQHKFVGIGERVYRFWVPINSELSDEELSQLAMFYLIDNTPAENERLREK